MGRGHVFEDPQKKAEMLSYITQGYSYPQVALHYGVDHTTLIYHAKQAGLVITDKETKDEIVRLVVNGKTVDEVAKIFNLPSVTVSTYCCRAGVKGCKIRSNRKEVVLRIAPKKTRNTLKKNNFHPSYKKNPFPARPGWIQDGVEGWVRAGKSIEIIKKEQEELKKKKAEKERMKMLEY